MENYIREKLFDNILRIINDKEKVTVGLNDDGTSVELYKVYGDDHTIANCARISYDADDDYLGSSITERYEYDADHVINVDKDFKVINKLLSSDPQHTSPFEQAEISFRIKAPIFVFRQMFRHRTANINEKSLRYTVISDNNEYPIWNLCSADRVKGVLPREKKDEIKELYDKILDTYSSLVKDYKIDKELARTILPLSTFSQCYFKMDLNNFMKFLILRRDKHAQLEIRNIARAMNEIALRYFPITLSIFEYVQYSKKSFEDYIIDFSDFNIKPITMDECLDLEEMLIRPQNSNTNGNANE